MKFPCEIIVKKVLPTLRAIIVKELVRKHKMTQSQIALKLGITQASVSYYLSGKRGKTQFEDEESLRKVGEEIADKIATSSISPLAIVQTICLFCKSLRSGGIVCKLHQEEYFPVKIGACNSCRAQVEL